MNLIEKDKLLNKINLQNITNIMNHNFRMRIPDVNSSELVNSIETVQQQIENKVEIQITEQIEKQCINENNV